MLVAQAMSPTKLRRSGTWHARRKRWPFLRGLGGFAALPAASGMMKADFRIGDAVKHLSLLWSSVSGFNMLYLCCAPPERGSPIGYQHGNFCRKNFFCFPNFPQHLIIAAQIRTL
jgi:hypothetical protein